MSAHSACPSPGFSGEFESEVALPVKVRYTVDPEGRVEITHLGLTGAAESASPLQWAHLPVSERRALVSAAEEEAQQV